MRKFIIFLGIAFLVVGGIFLGISIKAGAFSKKNVYEQEYVLENNIVDFSVDLKTANIILKKSEDGTNKVVMAKVEDQTFDEPIVEGNSLVIKQLKDSVKWYERIFNFNWQESKITVYLTSDNYGDFVVKSHTGNVTISEGFTFNNVNINESTGNVKFNSNVVDLLKINVSTGNIYASGVSANIIDFHTSTGNIKINSSDATEQIKLRASTGNITISDSTSNTFDSNTSTGNVKLINYIVNNKMTIITDTGDVKFDRCDASELSIKTDEGDVKGTLLTAKIFYAVSDTGKINVPHYTFGGICEIKTDTGDIVLKIAE